MNELKPCPFCGGKATISKTIDGMNWQIVCRGECRCTSAYFAQKENTVAAWNRRAAPENKPLTLEQLRQMDGEPVYIVVDGRPDLNAWHMVRRTDVGIIAIGAAAQTIYNYDGKLNFEGGTYYDIEHGNLYGKTWLAYARKPKQEEK